MADKDELKLEIEEEAAEQPMEAMEAAQSSMEDSPRPQAEPIAPAKSGSATRLLLLVLLLVALGAAAWFLYFAPRMGTAPAPRAAAPATPKRQAVPVPVRDQGAAQESAAKAGTTTAVPVPAKPAAAPAAAAKAESTPIVPVSDKSQGMMAKSSEAAPAKPTAAPVADGAPVLSRAVPAPAADVKTPPAGESPVETAPAVIDRKTGSLPPAADRDVYRVQVGAYSVVANLAQAEEQIRALGFKPLVKESRRTLKMVRLRVGTFFPSQGEAKIAEVTAAGGEPFFIKDRDLMVVYAGSFQSPQQARRLAERLQQRGVHVEQETVPTEVAISIVRFGDFRTRAQAEEAAARAREAGMDTLVVKSR